MAKKEIEVVVLKELTEVFDFTAALVKCIKEKGDYATILPKFVAAIEGIAEIPAELKETPELITTCAVGAANIAQVFVEKKDEE
jgi:hypothetical protein